ncbi:hypothetical protein B484DRAFT_314312, partial [Ochromonadaceae sp. CCMP2298]
AALAVEPENDKTSSTSETDKEAVAGTADEENECPVCKYIKAGPCKGEFLDWDA